MQISVTKSGDDVQARLTGSLEASTSGESLDHLLQVLRSGRKVSMDAHGLTEIDTSGIQILLALRKEARLTGRDLRVTHPSKSVLDVFRLIGLENFFEETEITR